MRPRGRSGLGGVVELGRLAWQGGGCLLERKVPVARVVGFVFETLGGLGSRAVLEAEG